MSKKIDEELKLLNWVGTVNWQTVFEHVLTFEPCALAELRGAAMAK